MEDLPTGILLGIALLGGWLALRGWLRRQDTGELFCRRCGHQVPPDGPVSGRCPECGLANLAAHLVRGRPAADRRLVGGGLALAASASILAVLTLPGRRLDIDWIRHAPTWYLLRSDVSAAAGFGTSRIDILRDRYAAHGLDTDEIDAFADMLVARAREMFAAPGPGMVRFSGMTLRILRDHPPDESVAAALLDDLMALEFRRGAIGIVHVESEGPGKPAIARLMVDRPVYLPASLGYEADFRDRHPALTADVVVEAVRQGGRDLLPAPVDLGIPRVVTPEESTLVVGLARLDPSGPPVEIVFRCRWEFRAIEPYLEPLTPPDALIAGRSGVRLVGEGMRWLETTHRTTVERFHDPRDDPWRPPMRDLEWR